MQHFHKKWLFHAFSQLAEKDLINELNNVEYFGKTKREAVSFDLICTKLFGLESIVETLKKFTQNDSKEATKKLGEQIGVIQRNIWDKAKSVLKIKKVIDEKALTQFLNYLTTEIYLLFTIETYKFTDDIQMNCLMAQTAFAKLTVNEVVNPYRMMPLIASGIHLSPEIGGILENIAIWLKGLYERSSEKIPDYLKDENGLLLPQADLYIGDEDDEKLHYWKPPLTKIALAVHHQAHFEALLSKLPQLKEQLLPVKQEVEKQQVEKIVVENEVENPIILTSPIITAQQVPVENLPPSKQIASSSALSSMGLYAQPKKEKVYGQLGELPFRALEGIKDKNPSVKFSLLKSYLKMYTLNEKQKTVITGHKKAIKNELNSYIDANFTTHGLPNLGFYPFIRPHSSLLTTYRDMLEASNDPAYDVRELCKLHVKLQNGADKSLELVEKILQDLFDILYTASIPEHEMTVKKM